MNIPLAAFLDSLKIEYETETCQRDMVIRNLFLLSDVQTSFLPDTLYVGGQSTCISKFPEKSYFILAGKRKAGCPPNVFFADYDCTDVLFNKALKSFYHFQNWDSQFRKYIYTETSMDVILKHCFLIMKNPAYIVDSTFKVISIDENALFSSISSIWKHLVKERYLSYDIVYNLKKSSELENMSMHVNASLCKSEYFNNQFINYNFITGNRIWGHLFFVGYCKKITLGDLALADYIGRNLLELFCRKNNPVEIFGKDYENFFIHLLNGTLNNPDLLSLQIRPWKWKISDSYCILSFRQKNDDITLYDVLSSKIEQVIPCRSIILNNDVIAVIHMPESDQEKNLKEKLEGFLGQYKCCGGISDIFYNLSDASQYLEQAKYALSYGKKLSKQCLLEYKDCVFDHLVEKSSEFCNLDIFVDKRVCKILEYDKVNHTDYLITLEAYLKNERRLNMTAAQLFIHRNTMAYRLERIRNFLNDDLEDPSVRNRILLSIHILKQKQSADTGSQQTVLPKRR